MLTFEEWTQIRYKVYVLALRDPIFRQLCLDNPAAAVLQATGITLPVGAKVEFVATALDKTYSCVLPPAPGTNATQQDEEDALIAWSFCTDFPTGGPPS